MKLFSLLYQGDVHPSTDEKLIPAQEFSELITAMELIERAKQDAERFRADLAIEADAKRKAAQEEGFAEGLAQFNAHLLDFEYRLKEMLIEFQKQILPLALKAAKKIVGTELQTHPETIVDIVIQALSPVVQNHRFTIYVNKADKDLLETEKPRLKDLLEQVQSFVIQERADVSPGGCIIETESGIINASIENQWRALEAAFARYQ